MPSTEHNVRSGGADSRAQAAKKLFYKIGNVCELTGTQPYILRFWESEFPQLAPQKSRSGQRLFRERDIETVRRIKQLLYEEGYTIPGARKRLEQERPETAAPPAAAAEEAPLRSAAGSTPAREPASRARGGENAPADVRKALKLVRRELETILRRLEPR